jgi:hypothetical protein
MHTLGHHISPTTWSWLRRLAWTSVLLWVGYELLWPAHGVRDAYVGRCDAHESIVVKSSAYSHPLDFEGGDAIGYGLFLRAAGSPNDLPIYNDSFSARDRAVGWPASYVGWNLAGWRWKKEAGHYKGPTPSNEFAPVPRGLPSSQARIFELPTGPYSRDATPPATETPLLMNIFLAPGTFSDAHFTSLADCLASHRADINRALALIRADFPYRSQAFYRPLRLGALVSGVPPWSDPDYVDQIRLLYGDMKPVKALPDSGLFTLYKGQSAIGIIDGKQVQLTVLPTGETQWLIDGARLPDEPSQRDVEATGLRDVVTASNGLMIGHRICHVDRMDECAKWIQPNWWNNDGSTGFWIFLQIREGAWASDPASLTVAHGPS